MFIDELYSWESPYNLHRQAGGSLYRRGVRHGVLMDDLKAGSLYRRAMTQGFFIDEMKRVLIDGLKPKGVLLNDLKLTSVFEKAERVSHSLAAKKL